MRIPDRFLAARLAMIASAFVLATGCGGDATPEIVAGIDGCASCDMVIASPATWATIWSSTSAA